MASVLALLPPAVAAVLLLRGLRPTLAALIAYAVGLSALLVFPTSLATLLQAEQRAAVTAAEVCAIILGGITLDELARHAGTMAAVGSWLRTVTRDVPHAVLLITLGLTPFFESITGFGIGAVIALSLLAAVGVAGPKRAMLALLGLVAVPWGALAPGTLVAARLAGVSYRWLGTLSGMLSLPVFLVAGAAALMLAVGRHAALARWPLLLRGALSLWIGITLVNAVLGTPLAGMLGSLLAIVALVVPLPRSARSVGTPLVLRAFAPYLALVGLLLLGRLAALLLTSVSTRVATVIAHPVAALTLTCAGFAMLERRAGREHAGWPRVVWQRWLPVAVTTLLFVLLGGVMIASGMTVALAHLVSALGPAYVLTVPWVGGVGGFLTGSNTGANAMFAAAQAQAASALGYSPLLMVAGQNVGAALLTMASPPRVSLVLSLLDPADRDPFISRLVLLVDGLALLALSLLLAAGARAFPA